MSDPKHGPQRPNLEARSDRQGRFEFLLAEGGSFHLVGGVEGQTATDVQVVLDQARPHQEAVLRLSPFLVIAGRVVDECFEPRAGVLVGCSPMLEWDWLQQCRSELQGIYARGPSAADGSFRFLVPAGCPYRLGYRPSQHLYAHGTEVMPPTENAVLVVRESDNQGFRVSGRVVSATTGAVIPVFRVNLVTHTSATGSSDELVAEGKDGTFAFGPMPVETRYSLRVEAEGLGTTTIGPFDATVREEQVTVRMPGLGSVVCTVLRSDGTPAVQAQIGLDHADGHRPFERWHHGKTGNDGRISLSGVPPGDYIVYASAATVHGGKAQGRITVRPDVEASLQLTLQP
jgi:hypothetical protein